MKQSQGFGAVAIIGLVAAALLVGGVVFVSQSKTTDVKTEAMMTEEKMMIEEETMEEESMMEKKIEVGQTGDSMEVEADTMMKKESMEGDSMMTKESMEGDSAMIKASGTYTAYSGEALAMAEKGKTVLFFHASWCPSCRGADADIVKNATTIPADVTILKVDYDKEVALKQKYGVTTQHTFVEVDANGALVEKWSGGTLAETLARL